MSDYFPDDWFADSKSLLFSLIDDFAKISFACILHEYVNVLLGTVKETLLETDNVGMIQRSQYSDFVCGVILFIIAKAKTFDLNRLILTFFIAIGFSWSFFVTRNTFPYEPTPSFLMNLYSGRAF